MNVTKLVKPAVYIGKDTRPTSDPLATTAKQALAVFDSSVSDFGFMTTPQLHFAVKLGNDANGNQPSEEEYYNVFSKAFASLVNPSNDPSFKLPDLWLDCAYGVGGVAMKKLAPRLEHLVKIHLLNVPEFKDASEHLSLNDKCGAEYAHKEKKLPCNYNLSNNAVSMGCLDGDADRLVFFIRENDEYVLIDGDKITALFAKVFDDLVKQLNLDLSVGVVQTAYANGASTIYIRKALGREDCVSFAATGVKHLHHKAKEYDIGVYFESNGHGTAIFSEKAYQLVNSKYNEVTKNAASAPAAQVEAASRLKGIIDLINPCVGDAISDFLAVVGILSVYKLSMKQWSDFYSDLPNVQAKVKVKDRTKIKTTPDETKVTSPANVQVAIDQIIQACNDVKARSFIRPSGTEDIVRVYAEATTPEIASSLATKVCQLVFDMLDGVGPRP